jgi:hypothetical protein
MSIDSYIDDLGISHKWLNDEVMTIFTALEKRIEYEARQSDERRAERAQGRTETPGS